MNATQRVLTALEARLRARFRLIDVDVRLPWSGARYRLSQPASFDRLLTAAAGDPEQQVPYWATLWPSGVALADLALQRQRQLRGQRVLELGCGLGLTATAVMEAGADLLVTDYAPEALLLCRQAVLRNTERAPRTWRINWRQPPERWLRLAPWPLVLAADVLYEARDVMPLLRLIEQIVAPDGLLWLAEPGRTPAEQFVERLCSRGWRATTVLHAGPWPDPQDARIVVRIHLLQRS
ncbi:class I SAM-dependent methyltransferase [Kallotenue papyrolyticum]|uniref:class I SAM-dependent methyltransferase n=1 Tax=Kallotenue papyrolyticum TaxID=1325125 RepID=UPI00047855A0|nr:methyltransferase [Kallotenue papyrolyticum]